MKRSFADILQGLDSDRAQKVARKLPAWAAVDGLEIPSALSLEQCSSSATAAYKANLAVSGGTEAGTAPGNRSHPRLRKREGPAAEGSGRGPAQPDVSGGSCPLREVETVSGFAAALPDPIEPCPISTILDLTGGLGVDSFAFSQVAERVVYFERNAELAAAAARNFTRLGARNIEVRCEEVTPETELPEADLIYADPARRDAAGRKVFLLEDCTPDILTLLPMLLRKAPTVLLKLSPMADLAMLAERLGPTLREIHVVELDGEVKEILCLLRHDAAPSEPEIIVVTLSGQAATAAKLRASRYPSQPGGWAPPVHEATGGHGFAAVPPAPEDCLQFRLSEERAAEVQYAAEVRPGDTLLEPCPALLKAGAFRLPCARWGLLKLATSTHLYLLPGANQPLSAPGNHLFKAHRVLEVRPLGAAAFKTLRKSYPRAEVTARNLPLGSAELQKRLGVAPGGDVHIFGCRLADGTSVLIVTEG